MLITMMLAALQDRPPEGGVTVRRVTDPAVACAVLGAMESRKTGRSLDLFTKRPKLVVEGSIHTLNWTWAPYGRGRANVTCVADVASTTITSIKVDNRELLTERSVY